jgi:hypothetical protein
MQTDCTDIVFSLVGGRGMNSLVKATRVHFDQDSKL